MASVQSFPPKNSKELRKILKKVELVNPIISNMLEMSALTGLRYCDCSTLTRREMMINNIIRDRIVIVQKKSFNKRVSSGMSVSAAKIASKLTVALTDQAKGIIEDSLFLSPDSVFLFESDRNPGKPYSAQYINRILKKVAIDMRLTYPLSTHSFRKSFALMLVENGAKMHELRDLLGHASLTSTNHYLSSFINDTDKHVASIKF
jgi:integrase